MIKRLTRRRLAMLLVTSAGMCAPILGGAIPALAVDASSFTIAGVGDCPYGAVSSADTVFVSNYDGENVSAITSPAASPFTGLKVDVGHQPYAMAVSGDKVFVGNTGDGTISVFSGGSLGASSVIASGLSPEGMAVFGSKLYVANDDERVSVVDVDDYSVTMITTGIGTDPFGVTVSDSAVFVSEYGSSQVAVIDPGTNTVVRHLDVGTHPRGMAVSGNKLYVVNDNASGTVSVVDIQNNTKQTVPVGTNPFGVVIIDTWALVTNPYSDSVSVIDTSTDQRVQTIALASGAYPFGITGRQGLAYVANCNGTGTGTVSVITPPIHVSSLSPATGTSVGGTAVTISGSGFVTDATVMIGGAACTSVTYVSAASLSCTTPAGTAGAANVVVTNPDTQTSTLTGGFTYTASGGGSGGGGSGGGGSGGGGSGGGGSGGGGSGGGGSGGGGGGQPAPSPVVTPSATPTATPSPAPSASAEPAVSGSSEPSPSPSASPLTGPPGVELLSFAERASARLVTVTSPAATSVTSAPVVTVPLGTPVAPVVGGLPANTPLQAGMSAPSQTRARVTFAPIGRTRSNAAGRTKVPAFKASRPGTYTIRLTTPNGRAFYLKVKVASSWHGVKRT